MKTLTIIQLFWILATNIPLAAMADGDNCSKTNIIACNSYITQAIDGNFSHILKPEEESYADDLPFNTERISAEYRKTEMMKSIEIPRMQAEEYSDDIPFNTLGIATLYLIKSGMAEMLRLKDESQANDFPFNTAVIAGNVREGKLPLVLTPEPYIDDIPFDTKSISERLLLNSAFETSMK
jgi:hypothetical protein